MKVSVRPSSSRKKENHTSPAESQSVLQSAQCQSVPVISRSLSQQSIKCCGAQAPNEEDGESGVGFLIKNTVRFLTLPKKVNRPGWAERKLYSSRVRRLTAGGAGGDSAPDGSEPGKANRLPVQTQAGIEVKLRGNYNSILIVLQFYVYIRRRKIIYNILLLTTVIEP